VLQRLPYLALTSVFAFIRLLPMSDADKDIEILTLRHQLGVLQRQIDKPRLTPPDRALLADLLHRLPRLQLRQLHLIVSPDTVLRWQCAARRLVVSPPQMGGTWRNVYGSDGLP
jgi:putative transposase